MGIFDLKNLVGERASVLSEYSLSGNIVPLQVKENARAKRMTMRLAKTGGGIAVTVPKGTRQTPVLNFLKQNENWLTRQFAKKPESSDVTAGALIPIAGEPHKIVHHKGRGTSQVHAGDDGLELWVYGDEAYLKRRVKDYLKREARAVLEPLSIKYADELGMKPSSVQFKDTKSRWGSCSSARNLSYSWRIAMAPMEVQDYLVAHEVSHLREMNHGPHFWAHVADLCPLYEQHKQWLRSHGAKLHAWNFE